MKNLQTISLVFLLLISLVAHAWKDRRHQTELTKVSGCPLPAAKLPPGEYLVPLNHYVIETVKPSDNLLRCYYVPSEQPPSIRVKQGIGRKEFQIYGYGLISEDCDSWVDIAHIPPKAQLDQLDDQAIKFVRQELHYIHSGDKVCVKLKNGRNRTYRVWRTDTL